MWNVSGRPGQKPGFTVYGWSERQRDLMEIKALATDRREKPKQAKQPT